MGICTALHLERLYSITLVGFPGAGKDFSFLFPTFPSCWIPSWINEKRLVYSLWTLPTEECQILLASTSMVSHSLALAVVLLLPVLVTTPCEMSESV